MKDAFELYRSTTAQALDAGRRNVPLIPRRCRSQESRAAPAQPSVPAQCDDPPPKASAWSIWLISYWCSARSAAPSSYRQRADDRNAVRPPQEGCFRRYIINLTMVRDNLRRVPWSSSGICGGDRHLEMAEMEKLFK